VGGGSAQGRRWPFRYVVGMRDVETVTANGRGRWYEPFSFELLDRTIVRWDEAGARSQTILTWEVVVADPRVGTRSFASEGARDAFLAEQFTDVVLTPVKRVEERERPHVMAECVGDAISSVTFVADYVQVRWQGRSGSTSYPSMTLYVWPFLTFGDHSLRRSDPGYVDALVGLIGCEVSAVDELLDRGLVVDFANGWRLIEPLDGTGLVGPEIAEYSGGEGRGMLWRPGDEPIDWISPPPL
jgi:hypothetical protein